MGNYYGYILVAKSREDAVKIADRAAALQKEMPATTGETVEFRPYESEKGKFGITYGTASGELGEAALKVVEGIAATFPQMKLHLYQTWNGPVYAEAISIDGEMIELEQAKDENGNPLLDEDDNVVCKIVNSKSSNSK